MRRYGPVGRVGSGTAQLGLALAIKDNPTDTTIELTLDASSLTLDFSLQTQTYILWPEFPGGQFQYNSGSTSHSSAE